MLPKRYACALTTACRAFAFAAALLGWVGADVRASETEVEITRWLQDAEDQPVIAEPPSKLSPPITQEEENVPGTTEHPSVSPGRDQPLVGDYAPPDLRCLNPNYQPHGPEEEGFWDFFPLGMCPWSARTPISERHSGDGDPLISTSWLNRPFHAGWFIGSWSGDELISNQVDQHTSFFGGYRVGWDYDYYWGTEARLGLSSPRLADLEIANDHRTADVLVADLNLLYYPWGDVRLRPYATMGLGVGYFIFRDSEDRRFREVTPEIPLGIGVKYRWHEWLSLRAELLDNIMFENAGLASMHNFSLTGGVEVRFGGTRTHYWPWHPGGHLW